MTTEQLASKVNARVEKMIAEQIEYNVNWKGHNDINGNPMGDFSTIEEITAEAERIELWIEAKREKENNSYVPMTTVKVERETEKAILIVSIIRDYRKSTWMPKSVCEVLENGNILVKSWFAAKENLTPIW